MAGNIKGITIEFRGDTTKLETALTKIRKETKGLDSELRQIDRALKFNPGNTDLLAQKQQVLKEKIEKTRQSLNELRQAQQKLDDDPSVDKTSEEYRKLQREIIESESKLKHFEQELARLDRYKLEQLGKSMQDIGGKMKNAGKSLTMYVTTPLVAAGGKAVKTFAEVDKTMTLTNQTMGNSTDQAKMLDKAMRDAAESSTYSIGEAANATLNFARAGLNAEEAASALAPAMSLAAGEGGNLDTVSAGLVGTINGFGDSFDKASDYADIFANACNNSALNVDDLAKSMGVAAPAFHAAGGNVKDAALALGIMANRNIDANKAANALKSGMFALADPVSGAREAMEKYGITTSDVWDKNGNMKSMLEIQGNLHKSFETLTGREKEAAAQAIFGKNQGAAWLALIEAAPDEVEELALSLEKMGTAQSMAAAMMAGFGGKIDGLKSKLDVASYSMGKALAPAVEKVVDAITKAVEWFNKLDEKHQTLVAKIGVLLAALGPLLVIGGTLLDIVGKSIENFGKFGKVLPTGPLSKFTGILKRCFGFLAANPILLVVAALAGLALAFKKSGMSADELQEMVQKVVDKAVQFIEGFAQKLPTMMPKIVDAGIKLFNGLIDGLNAILPPLLSALIDVITALVQSLPQVLPPLINGAIQLFMGLVDGLLNVLPSLIKGLGDLISKLCGEMPKYLPPILKAAVEMFMGIVKAIPQIVAALLKALPQIVKAFVSVLPAPIQKVFEGIKDAAVKVFEGLKKALEVIVTAIKTVIIGIITVLAVTLGTLWEGIRVIATLVWDHIKGYVLPVVKAIKDGVTKTFETLRDALSKVWGAIKTATQTAWNAVKEHIITPVSNAYSKVKGVVDTLRSSLSNAWNSIKSTASTTWNAIKSTILKPVETLRDKIKEIIEKIKGFFKFKVPTPHIPVPKFSISPSGWKVKDLLNGSIPHLSVSWHKKGGIFDKPTIFANGVGEAGPEAVVPLDTLWQKLDGMADSIVNGIIMGMQATQMQTAGDITIPIYLYPSGPKMGEETVRAYDKYKKILG